MQSLLKSHYCRDIKQGQIVKLAGWVSHLRHIGKDLVFVSLRDETGTVQVKISNESLKETLKNASIESVVSVSGTVVQRPNADILKSDLGHLEVEADQFQILNHASELPFSLKEKSVNEEYRLKYRHVDLRRPAMVENIRKRQEIVRLVRRSLEDDFGFHEFETPLLFKSTPEGASEYLVPANNSGYYYALPQSPQQMKQVLMASGFERYYQIAKCFRNESQGANRQPEFTQIDLEAAFCTQDSLMDLIEKLIKNLWERYFSNIQVPFKRMDYRSAMARYGSDKPDTRFGMEIMDLTKNIDESKFDQSSCVEAIIVPQGRSLFKDKEWGDIRNHVLSDIFPYLGPILGKELLFVSGNNFSREKLAHILPNLDINSSHPLNSLESKDLVILNRRKPGYLGGFTVLGRVRSLIGDLMEKKGVLSSTNHQFLWVHSFPMFFPNMNRKNITWSASHHPFTAPIKEHSELVFSKPSEAIGQNFDLVLNGIELGGGSIRIFDSLYQERIFKDILGMPAENVDRDFGHLLKALTHGCPPHGGIALGLDRLTSIICATPNIRDVIAFPKLAGRDYLVNSPSKLN